MNWLHQVGLQLVASIFTCQSGGEDNGDFSVSFLAALHETERFDGALMPYWFLLPAGHQQQALPAVIHYWYACCFSHCPALSCPALSCPALPQLDLALTLPCLSLVLPCPRSNCADVLPCSQLYTDIAGVQHRRIPP